MQKIVFYWNLIKSQSLSLLIRFKNILSVKITYITFSSLARAM